MAEFDALPPGLESPADDFYPVTPNDGVDLPTAARYFLVGTAGDLRVTTRAGNDVTIPVPVGYVIGRAVKVWATGTTAAGITAFV